jgi:hypothetical protein
MTAQMTLSTRNFLEIYISAADLDILFSQYDSVDLTENQIEQSGMSEEGQSVLIQLLEQDALEFDFEESEEEYEAYF